MEQQTQDRESTSENKYIFYRLWELRNAVDRFLIELGVGHYCHVTVNRKGEWFELNGQIDSRRSRGVIFSMVPPINGKRYVVDKMRIVNPPATRGVLS